MYTTQGDIINIDKNTSEPATKPCLLPAICPLQLEEFKSAEDGNGNTSLLPRPNRFNTKDPARKQPIRQSGRLLRYGFLNRRSRARSD